MFSTHFQNLQLGICFFFSPFGALPVVQLDLAHNLTKIVVIVSYAPALILSQNLLIYLIIQGIKRVGQFDLSRKIIAYYASKTKKTFCGTRVSII